MRIDYFRDGYGLDPARETIAIVPMRSQSGRDFFRLEFADEKGHRVSIDLYPRQLDQLRRSIQMVMEEGDAH